MTKATATAKPKTKRAYKPRAKKAPAANGGGGLANMGKRIAHGIVDTGIDKLQSFFKTLVGSGDYQIAPFHLNQNSLMNDGLQQAPQMHSGNMCTNIRHREYICDITSSSSPGQFKIESFALNAGDQRTFPWLSGIAKDSYQKWRPKGIVIEFKSTSADALNSTNTALGTVVMATNYCAVDVPYNSKIQMEQTEFACSSKPSNNILHPIECKPGQGPLTELYIDNGFDHGAFDPRFDSLGNFYIATVGLQGASVNVGELWISYDIDLLTPTGNKPLLSAKNAVYALDIANVTTSALLGTSARTKLMDNLDCIFDTANQITIPRSNLVETEVYELVIWYRGGSTLSVEGVSVTPSGAFVAVPAYANNTIPYMNYPTGPTTTYDSVTRYMFGVRRNTSDNGVLTLTCGVLPSSLTSVDFEIIQHNSGPYLN